MKLYKKIPIIILASLLSISVIWALIFWLTEIRILNNSITDILWSIYWDVYPAWISVLVAVFNLLFAIIKIKSINKTRITDKNPFRTYLSYLILSIAALVINCITSNYILGCVITSV